MNKKTFESGYLTFYVFYLEKFRNFRILGSYVISGKTERIETLHLTFVSQKLSKLCRLNINHTYISKISKYHIANSCNLNLTQIHTE